MSALRALPIRPHEQRLADRDAAVYALVSDIVTGARLSPRRDAELHAAGAERIRRVLDRLELAVVSATALDREELAADQHVQVCSHCRHRWQVVSYGVCSGFRAIRRTLDRLHRGYRRHFRRLEAAS